MASLAPFRHTHTAMVNRSDAAGRADGTQFRTGLHPMSGASALIMAAFIAFVGTLIIRHNDLPAATDVRVGVAVAGGDVAVRVAVAAGDVAVRVLVAAGDAGVRVLVAVGDEPTCAKYSLAAQPEP